MVMIERKGLIFTAIIVSLAGILTGLFLGGDFPLSQAAQQLYDERATQTVSKTIVTHLHDGLPMHQHLITTVVTTTETTPHGDFLDFAATPPPAQQEPIPPEITPAPEPPPAQQEPIPPEITPAPIPTLTPVRGDYEVRNFYDGFRPFLITVPVGTTVTWTNKDTYTHNVKSNDDLFNGLLFPGGSDNYTFTRPGIFSYHCDIHPGMAGTVIVE